MGLFTIRFDVWQFKHDCVILFLRFPDRTVSVSISTECMVEGGAYVDGRHLQSALGYRRWASFDE